MPVCPYCNLSFEVRPTRSNYQNKYLWGVCYALLSQSTGHTPEELHEFFKAEFLPQKNLELSDHGHVITTSTTGLDTKEFNEFIEKIRMFAAQKLSIVIPDPNEPVRTN